MFNTEKLLNFECHVYKYSSVINVQQLFNTNLIRTKLFNDKRIKRMHYINRGLIL